MVVINVYGLEDEEHTNRAKKFLESHKISYNFLEIKREKKEPVLIENIDTGKVVLPTLVINDVSYPNPSDHTLESLFGINKQGRVSVFGTDWCPDTNKLKAFFQNNNINFEKINVDKCSIANSFVRETNNGECIIPTVVINGVPYTNPDHETLIEVLQIEKQKSKKTFDVIIIGAGAAGLTASIYAQRESFRTVILEKSLIGGNASLTDSIENYPGFEKISGPNLMQKMAQQALIYGAIIEMGVSAKTITKEKEDFVVTTNKGNYYAKTLLLSVGTTYRKLNINGEEDLIGKGVHFNATIGEDVYRNEEVIVVGGGNSALEEGIFLSGFCKKVKIVNLSPEFSASKTYVEKIKTISNIETFLNRTSMEFLSENDTFTGLKVKKNDTQETEIITGKGAFVFIGLKPNTDFLKGIVGLNKQGQIVTGILNKTNVDGIFAAGDCREGTIAQVAAATGEGIIASYGIREFFDRRDIHFIRNNVAV